MGVTVHPAVVAATKASSISALGCRSLTMLTRYNFGRSRVNILWAGLPEPRRTPVGPGFRGSSSSPTLIATAESFVNHAAAGYVDAAEGRVSQAINRVQNLTFGARRPGFIPAEGGSQAWQELRERLDEAGQRAREACSSIEPPR